MQHFLTPVLALILWTMVMWVWMYIRRIPAMNAISRRTQDFIDDPKLKEQLPAKARWVAENYNHLHEQPVIFYALMFYIYAVGQGDSVTAYLAWAYVTIRIMHSFIHVTTNQVLIRFGLFAIGSLVLMAMALKSALALF